MSIFKNSYSSLSRQKPSKRKGSPIKLNAVDSQGSSQSQDSTADRSISSDIFKSSPEKSTKKYSKSKRDRLLSYTKTSSFDSETEKPQESPVKKSTANYVPESDDSDDSLIDLSEIKAKAVEAPQEPRAFEELDELIKSNKRKPDDELLGSSKKIAIDDVTEINLEEATKHSIEEVKSKYAHMNIPRVPISRKELLQRIEPHLEIVPGILKSTIGVSEFYKLAQAEKKNSGQASLRQKDKFLINWDKFYAGYFGFDRQQFVASVILSTYSQQLMQAEKRNATVAYWNVDNFSKYVLANEVLLRLAAEDLKCSVDDAYRIFAQTVEYGKIVSDSKPLVNDLGVDVLYKNERQSFMKGIDDTPSEDPKSTKTSQGSSVLEKMFDLSDSDDD